jgi:hypothetical protein
MLRTTYLIVMAAVILIFPFSGYSEENDTIPPRVISTTPQNGSQNVDPTTTEISVTFNEPMMDKNWSWCFEDKNAFPETTGQPFYINNYTKCVLPVKLKANKEYVIWINTVNFKNFKDKAGNPAGPYKFTFRTK